MSHVTASSNDRANSARNLALDQLVAENFLRIDSGTVPRLSSKRRSTADTTTKPLRDDAVQQKTPSFSIAYARGTPTNSGKRHARPSGIRGMKRVRPYISLRYVGCRKH